MKIELKPEEVQYVLQVLSRQPYAEVAAVLNAIAQQAQEQQAPAKLSGNGQHAEPPGPQ